MCLKGEGVSGFTPPPLFLKVHLKWKCGISKFPIDRILNCIYFCIFPEPCQNIFRVYLKLLEFPLSSIILRLETRVYQFYISASKNQRRGGKLEIYFLYYQTFSAHFILTLMNNYTSRRFKFDKISRHYFSPSTNHQPSIRSLWVVSKMLDSVREAVYLIQTKISS